MRHRGRPPQDSTGQDATNNVSSCLHPLVGEMNSCCATDMKPDEVEENAGPLSSLALWNREL